VRSSSDTNGWVARPLDGSAIEWLVEAFGFEKKVVVPNDDGTIAHAELSYGNGMVMLGSADKGSDYDRIAPPPGTGSCYVVVEDVDAHHAAANRCR
jgi:uncharacterized glyoxalase superfamily protein PhnB